MCGINGFYNFASSNIDRPYELLDRMNAAIQYRGPDGSGTWSDNSAGVHLGHQRLSILDLSENGRQPMHGSRGTTIVFNGEIYNFRKLREDLADYRFSSNSDTEVLLALYEKHGKKMLSCLNGMFAFSLWDSKAGRLFLARDRVGIKPLYYTTSNGIFSFSSEIKSLLELPWNKAELDESALYDFLTFNRVSPPSTVFKDIYKLHPGYMMVVGKNGIERYEQYWDIDYSDYHQLGEAEISNRIVDELEKSVSYRMVSDVPVGAFLSGGVDSSAIVSCMTKLQTTPVKTYSIGFDEETGVDERRYADLIAGKYATEHYEKIVTQDDVIEFLPKVVDIYDEPLADATSIPMYFLSQLARENGTIVVLTGDGADELFFGYRSWMKYMKLYPYYRKYLNTPSVLRNAVSGIYNKIGNNSITREMLERAAKQQELFWGGAGGFKESMKSSIISADYKTRMSSRSSYAQIEEYRKSFDESGGTSGDNPDVGWMTYIGLKYIVPNFYLYRADRMGMANSIELRVPFLDHNFVNMAMSIPARLKTRNNEPKYILKKSLEGILPDETLYRRKQGFCVPLQQWAGDIMVNYIEKNLSGFCNDTGLFNEQGMRQQLSATRAGKSDFVFSLWNFYFLMIWFRRWMM